MAASSPVGRIAASPLPAAMKAGVERELGVRFTPDLIARGRMSTVVVDVRKLDANLEKEIGHHVGPGGSGAAKPGSYSGFQEFLAQARAKGIAVEQPRIVLNARGNPSIANGRHRFAVLRDMGVAALPVSVPRHQAATFRHHFGVS